MKLTTVVTLEILVLIKTIFVSSGKSDFLSDSESSAIDFYNYFFSSIEEEQTKIKEKIKQSLKNGDGPKGGRLPHPNSPMNKKLLSKKNMDTKKIWHGDTSISSDSEYHVTPMHLMKLISGLERRFVYTVIPFKTGNIVCSPIAAMLTLGKLVFGAKGETEREILSAIGSNHAAVSGQLKQIIKSLRKLVIGHLDIASQVFLPEGKKLKGRYEEDIQNTFNTKVVFYDPNDETAASSINSWFSAKTHGRFRDVVHSGDVSHPSAIAVNTIYFLGYWKYPFHHRSQGKFYDGTDGISLITMMTVTAPFTYGKSKSLDANIIKIPYEGGAELCIVLPQDVGGLSLLLQQLNLAPDIINQVPMAENIIKLTIPKFKIESRIDLKPAFLEVGINDIFSSSAGLKNMVNNETIVVTKAIQKAIIEVTDEYTTPKDAGGIERGAEDTFNANHPFLFFVLANRQQILAGVFTG